MTGTVENPRTAGIIAIAAIATYQLLLILLILLRPDLDPYWHTISEWAIGPYGWLMSAGFMISGLSYVALLFAARPQLSGITGIAASVLLLICAIGAFGVGAFTTDPFTVEQLSTTGILHVIFGMAQLMLLPFAAILTSASLAANHRADKWVRNRIIVEGLVPLAGFAGFIIHLALYVIPLGENARGPDVPIGWPPRILFFSYAVWVIATSLEIIGSSERQDV